MFTETGKQTPRQPEKLRDGGTVIFGTDDRTRRGAAGRSSHTGIGSLPPRRCRTLTSWMLSRIRRSWRLWRSWLHPLLCQHLKVVLSRGTPAVICCVVTVTVRTLHLLLMLLSVVVYPQTRFLGQRTLVGYVSSSTFDALWRQSTVPGTVSKALTTVALGCVGRPLSEVPPIYQEPW